MGGRTRSPTASRSTVSGTRRPSRAARSRGARFDRAGTRIALVHGSDEDRCPPGKRATAPFTLAEIAASGATLRAGRPLSRRLRRCTTRRAARGSRIRVRPNRSSSASAARTARSSSRVEDGRVALEAVELARTRLIDVDVPLDDAASEYAVLGALETALAPFGRDDFLRVRLRRHGRAGNARRSRSDRRPLRRRARRARDRRRHGRRRLRRDRARAERARTRRRRTARARATPVTPTRARALRSRVAAFAGGELRRSERMSCERCASTGFGRLARPHVRVRSAVSTSSSGRTKRESRRSPRRSSRRSTACGAARRKRWRPWDGSAYATALAYETADGAAWEVHRALERDTKGVRVFDAAGADAAARLGAGEDAEPRRGAPAHPARRRSADGVRAAARRRARGRSADEVAAALAHALGGGPKEDAALGALARLEEAQRKHVGTERAHKNVPLKRLRDLETEQLRAAADARAALERRWRAARSDRRRANEARARRRGGRGDRAAARATCAPRTFARGWKRSKSTATSWQRAGRARNVRRRRERSRADRVAALDDAYHSWRSSASVAEAAARNVADEALTVAEARRTRRTPPRRRARSTMPLQALRPPAPSGSAPRARRRRCRRGCGRAPRRRGRTLAGRRAGRRRARGDARRRRRRDRAPVAVDRRCERDRAGARARRIRRRALARGAPARGRSEAAQRRCRARRARAPPPPR